AHDCHRRGARPFARRSRSRRRQRRTAPIGHCHCGRARHRHSAHPLRIALGLSLAGAPGRKETPAHPGRLGERLMSFLRRIAALLRAAFFAPSPAFAQSQTPAPPLSASEPQRPHLAFNDFLTEALRYNLDLAAQRANISISQAAVTSASVTPDWSANFGLPLI